MKSSELHGHRFGRLTVIRCVTPYGEKIKKCLCICDCGNETVVPSSSLHSGNTKSCGCLKKEITSRNMIKRNTTHGLSKTHLYRVWHTMIDRCESPNDQKYSIYGNRGICVCVLWHIFENFYAWAMASGYQKGLTIERIDNNGNYEPSNCKWATAKEQANNKSNNHFLEFNGQKKTMSQWAEILGIKYTTLRSRINRSHWSVEKALTT